MTKVTERRVWGAVTAAAVMLAILLASSPTAGATTNPAASVTVTCVDGDITAGFTYSGFSPKNSLTASQVLEVLGVEVASSSHSFDGPGSTDTLSAHVDLEPGETVDVTASTSVFGGGGNLKASASASTECSRPDGPPPCVGCTPPPCETDCSPPPDDPVCTAKTCGELPHTGGPGGVRVGVPLGLAGLAMVAVGIILVRRRGEAS